MLPILSSKFWKESMLSFSSTVAIAWANSTIVVALRSAFTYKFYAIESITDYRILRWISKPDGL